MDQQWVLKSLTIWGVIITTLTALLPAINGLLALVNPEWAFTPAMISGLNEGIKLAIQGIGAAVGVILVIVDRFSGETAKTLTWNNPDK